MPISSVKGKSIIKCWFSKQSDIKTIIDLGPGSGTYPKLLGYKKYVWLAVEIWGPYIERFKLNKKYQEIRVGDIQYMNLPDGDCAILGDVLEHMDKKAAIKTFKKVNKQFKHVVISIPINSNTQYVFENNIFEKHKSIWSLEELEKLIPKRYEVRKVVGSIVVFIK